MGKLKKATKKFHVRNHKAKHLAKIKSSGGSKSIRRDDKNNKKTYGKHDFAIVQKGNEMKTKMNNAAAGSDDFGVLGELVEKDEVVKELSRNEILQWVGLENINALLQESRNLQLKDVPFQLEYTSEYKESEIDSASQNIIRKSNALFKESESKKLGRRVVEDMSLVCRYYTSNFESVNNRLCKTKKFKALSGHMKAVLCGIVSILWSHISGDGELLRGMDNNDEAFSRHIVELLELINQHAVFFSFFIECRVALSRIALDILTIKEYKTKQVEGIFYSIFKKLALFSEYPYLNTCVSALIYRYNGLVSYKNANKITRNRVVKKYIVNLMRIDQDITYKHMYTHLKNYELMLNTSNTNHSPEKKGLFSDSFWDLASGLDLWCSVVCDQVNNRIGKPDKYTELMMPMVDITQYMNNSIHEQSSVCQLELCNFVFKTSRILINLSSVGKVNLGGNGGESYFISGVTSSLLQVLASLRALEDGDDNNQVNNKAEAICFENLLRVGHVHHQGIKFQSYCYKNAMSLLVNFIDFYCSHVAFPELIGPVIRVLEEVQESFEYNNTNSSNLSLAKPNKNLITKLRELSIAIMRARDLGDLAPIRSSLLDEFSEAQRSKNAHVKKLWKAIKHTASAL